MANKRRHLDNNGTTDYEWTRVRQTNGKYGYVKTRNSRPIEFSSTTGKFRVYDTPNNNAKSFETVKDNAKVTNKQIGIQRTLDDHNAALERDRKADEITKNRVIDLQGENAREIVGFIPYVGDALDVKDIGSDLYKGNYINAGIGATMLALPNIIEKPLKRVYNFFKPTTKKAINSLKDAITASDSNWDYLYNKAIKSNNINEAQRLRDLHFKAKARHNAIMNEDGSLKSLYHTGNDNYPSDWHVYDPNYENQNSFFYTTDNSTMSASYSPSYNWGTISEDDLMKSNQMKAFYGMSKNPVIIDGDNHYWNDIPIPTNHKSLNETKKQIVKEQNDLINNLLMKYGIISAPLNNALNILNNKNLNPIIKHKLRSLDAANLINDLDKVEKIPNKYIIKRDTRQIEKSISKIPSIDSGIIKKIKDYGGGRPTDKFDAGDVIMFRNGNTVKYKKAITKDDKGRIIPLSKRDNFNNYDFRYSWMLPTIGLGVYSASKINNINNKTNKQ